MSVSADDLATLLEALHRNAIALATTGPRPPRRVRVGVGDATVELEWDDAVAVVPVTPAPAPAAAVVAAPIEVAEVAAAAPAGHVVAAPTVGTFYRAPEPGAAPFVSEGDVVAAGQQIGIVEAMKLMIPVEATQAGRVEEIVCADATPVEFGAPLLVLSAVTAAAG
jgi:acetyl-CoA carboxylase biotin carboxyl carrier protein